MRSSWLQIILQQADIAVAYLQQRMMRRVNDKELDQITCFSAYSFSNFFSQNKTDLFRQYFHKKVW